VLGSAKVHLAASGGRSDVVVFTRQHWQLWLCLAKYIQGLTQAGAHTAAFWTMQCAPLALSDLNFRKSPQNSVV